MKKILSILLVLLMLLSASAALAEGMGVQVIGGPETETEPVSLDDVKLNVDVEIEGYGILNFTSYACEDELWYYEQGKHDNGTGYYSSGTEADFVLLKCDIVNTNMVPKNYLDQCEVKVVYDDVYEYLGWAYQYNYDNKSGSRSYNYYEKIVSAQDFVIDIEDQFAINPMYQGHYVFGCTLPNAVVNSKAPLKMIITIDGNEITYNIRK